jgi:thiol-disulfide isomerase/thioredoxin
LLLAGALVVVSIAWFGTQQATQDDGDASVRYDAASKRLSFTLPRFSGGQLQTQSLLGRPVIVNFYASWCSVCRAEMPEFERLSRDAAGQVAVIGVNPQVNDDDASQADLVAETGVTYPTVRDRNDTLLRVFNPSGALPTTVFLDAAGRVHRVVYGQLTEGQLTRILAADFGIQVTPTLPDRSGLRTRLPTVSPAPSHGG